MMGTANFWFTLVVTLTILLVPVVAERFYLIDTRPTLSDKVRLKQRMSKSKSKSGELIIRRASTFRRSQRSMRSGYAFAHQEGFGELITTGNIMQMKRRRLSTANSLKLCLPIGNRRSATNLKETAQVAAVHAAQVQLSIARQTSAVSRLSSTPSSVGAAGDSLLSVSMSTAAGSQPNSAASKRLSPRFASAPSERA